MARWENFNINDRQNAVENVVIVNITCDDFFPNMMYLFLDGLLYDSWSGIISLGEQTSVDPETYPVQSSQLLQCRKC